MSNLLPQALELLLGSTVKQVQNRKKVGLSVGDDPTARLLLYPSTYTRARNAQESPKHFGSFLCIPSGAAPRWVLPIAARNAMLAATDIYQPHKTLARIGKYALKRSITFGLEGWLGQSVLLECTVPPPFKALIRDVTGEVEPLFALSFGRRSAVRKLSVQVLRPDGQVLGYIKIPFTTAATSQVKNEAATLERLSTFSRLRPHIPRLLHAGAWGDSYLLFQSPLLGKRGPTTITKIHETFLDTLWNAQRTLRSGADLIADMGALWEAAAGGLDSQWRSLGREVLRRSSEDMDRQTIPCGIGHGDFAPWNTRENDGSLLVFDWESAQWAVPLSWDVFHFNLQTAVSLNTAQRNRGPVQDAGGPYLLYLLRSLVQFIHEDNRQAMDNRRKMMIDELRRPARSGADFVGTAGAPAAIVVRSRRVTAEPEPRETPLRTIVTTSWDDGNPSDMRVAELLQSRQLAGTFYIPTHGYLNGPTLTPNQIRILFSAGLDVGAHSVSHESLTRIKRREDLTYEVTACKDRLEQIIGAEVSMFCYPNGRYDYRVIGELKRAGYKGARTTRMLSVTSTFNPFEIPTSVQVFPHLKSGYVRDLGRAKNIPGIWRFTTQLSGLPSWIALGKELFDQALQKGGIWHLYGHSWEIEQLALWKELEEMLDYVANRNGVIYASNEQILSTVTCAANF